MKKLLLFLTLIVLLYVPKSFAQLVAGDIAFIGMHTDLPEDGFTWISLTDIPASTEIYFTEKGWNAGGGGSWFANAEAQLRYIAPAGGLSCGTIVHINETASNTFSITAGTGTIALVNGSFSLSAGDQVLAYRGGSGVEPAVPVFLAGVHGDYNSGDYNGTTTWNNGVSTIGGSPSMLPAGLTNGVNCISLYPAPGPERDNSRYTGTLTGTSAALLASINNASNWTGSDSAFSIAPAAYSTPSVTCAAPNTAPTIGSTSSGQSVNDTSIISPFSAITTTDADGDNLTATITLDTNAKGVITGASSGSGPYTITSRSPAAMQTALRSLVFNPTDNRAAVSETTTFTVVINDGTDTDSDNGTTVISNAVAPTFNSADSTPNDNATGVTAANNIIIDFNENIAVGTGFITLRNVTGGSDTETFNVATENDGATTTPTPGRIGIVNDKVYINPLASLSHSNVYAIQIASSAIDDLGGASFAGISDETTFNFTTSAITWIGTTADWSNPNNWSSNSTPVASDDIIIPNVGMKPVITSGTSAVANNITIDASSSLTINTGGSLTMDGDLTQNGIFTINSDATSNGSLIVKGTHAGVGTVDYARYLSTSGDALKGWHLISSPVNGKNIDEFFGSLVTNGTKRGVAPYINTNGDTFKWAYYTTADTPGFFTEGKGYTMKKSTAGTLTFNGFLNTNNAGIPIEVKATGDQFNAIGNPYTSYINSGLFLDNVAAGRLTEKTIWLWDEAGNAGAGEYITTNSATAYKVAPGQGFFVKALATGNVTFSEAIQTHVGGDTFLREESKPEIKLSLTDGTNVKAAEVFYIEDKTTGFDDGYDSSMFGGVANPFAVYTQLVTDNQGKNLAIQTLPDINYENMVVPIGVNAESGKEIVFSLEASNFSSDMKIYLEDRSTNTFTRLEEANSTYTVTLTESLNGIGRFYLHTTESALSVDNGVTLANISIYKLNNSTVKITGLQQGKASIKLFNILGKQVLHNSFTTNGTKEISLPKLAIGVYVVKLTTENGKLNKKIIIE